MKKKSFLMIMTCLFNKEGVTRLNKEIQNFLNHLDRVINLSNTFVEYSCINETAFFLLTAQIEDLEKEYKKVDALLECIR